ncbi:MAG: T9SS type A sorting domain-containing protein [Flavobacterium sp.]|uniref:T9SS type A sorting domain-containing protein n=1 Tax=Flavobacterium sp. TaxID=239 RepID=UPI00120E57B1|nr:T9SS type A sorting domain-containing protein [Flavobacterium sp.]RZJ68105.1 MAG: T9SS type A sorting domain-containing protein [Flavobacterium sp.]
MKKTLLLASFSTCLFVQAQVPQIQWTKALGGSASEYSEDIAQTPDGGFIAVGTTASNNQQVTGNHGAEDVWVVKTDALGNIEWQKCYGGSSSEEGNAIRTTSDGGYIIAGAAASNNGDISGGHGSNDFWVLKLTSTGVVSWQKCLGGTIFEWAEDIQQTADGGYIIAGSTQSTTGDVSGNHGGEDAWVVKLDASGNLQWQRCLGGTGTDTARSVTQTQDGGYILLGLTNSNNGDVTGNHGGNDFFVSKLSPTGTVEWTKALGGTASDVGQWIVQSPNGKYICAGSTASNNGNVTGNHGGIDVWMVQLDASGTVEWQKCFGGTGSDVARCVQSTVGTGYIIAGDSSSSNNDATQNNGNTDFWVVSIDATGNIQWQKSLGGSSSDSGTSVRQTADGGFIVTGSTPSNDIDVVGNHGIYDFWLVKFAPEPLAVASNHTTDFRLSPNPALDLISFSETIENASIIDISGRVVGTITNSDQLEISGLKTGMYWIVGTISGRSIKQKFVKK